MIIEELCQCDNCNDSIVVYFDTEWPEQPFCDSDCAMEYYSDEKTKDRKSNRIDVKLDLLLNDSINHTNNSDCATTISTS